MHPEGHKPLTLKACAPWAFCPVVWLLGFLAAQATREPAAHAGDVRPTGSIRVGKSLEEAHGSPLWCCLKPMEQRSWLAAIARLTVVRLKGPEHACRIAHLASNNNK